jgi:hypothetical protein
LIRILKKSDQESRYEINSAGWDDDIDPDAARLDEDLKCDWWQVNKSRFIS